MSSTHKNTINVKLHNNQHIDKRATIYMDLLHSFVGLFKTFLTSNLLIFCKYLKQGVQLPKREVLHKVTDTRTFATTLVQDREDLTP